MQGDASASEASSRYTAILKVLEEVTARRLDGAEVADEAVIADHVGLMPELGDQLRALRSVEIARGLAGEVSRFGGSSRLGALDEVSRAPLPDLDSFQGYEIHEVAGRGGMGIVYRALQTATRREVAVKVMFQGPFAGPHDQARFEREARILAQLKHPNIVTIYDTGLSLGRFFIVMDYIAGMPLDAYVASRKLSVRETLALFAKVCDAVNSAHLRGVIHRDLKPSNIRTDSAGEPHLLDFGLATVTAEDGDSLAATQTMTMTGQFVGSLPWSSPEQAQGASDRIDLRTDVYSLGVILYQLLTGCFPYRVVGNIRDVIDNILTADPDKPSAGHREIDNEVETIVLKCLAKEPDRRYQSAGELARDVRHYLNREPIEAKRDSGWYVLRKGLRRYRAAVAVVAAFMLLSTGFGVSMSVLYHKAQHETQRTKRTLGFLQDTLFAASSKRLGSDATLVEALDQAAQRMEGEFVDEPEIEAALHYTIGSAYETLWQKETAVDHLRRAVQLNREVYGLVHPDTVRSMVLLGMVLGELGDGEAVEVGREALRVSRKLYGNRHRLVAESLDTLAFALWASAQPPKWEEAQRCYHEALAVYGEAVGSEDAGIARCLHGFAAMRHAEGKLDEAERLYRESLDMSRGLLGLDHQFVMECMEGYAGVLQGLGRFDEAESLLRQVLDRTPRLFGNASVPQVLSRLASVQRAEGDLPAAEETLRQGLAMVCRQLAGRNGDHTERLNSLAASLQEADAAVSPSVYVDAARAIKDLTDLPNDAARIFMAMAQVVRELHGCGEAEPLLRECLCVLDKSTRKSPWLMGSAMSSLGQCLVKSGRYDEANPLLERAYEILRGAFGESHPATRRVLDDLVSAYEAVGEHDKASHYRGLLTTP